MLSIRPRSSWNAAPPKKVSKMSDSRYGWITHYNGPAVSLFISPAQFMQSIQRYHQISKGWRDFAYSFMIDQDGVVWEGRGWFVVGGHTSGRFKGTGLSSNSHAHAVLFMVGGDQAPSQKALDAFAELVERGEALGVPKIVTPHNIAAPSLGTSCPGVYVRQHTLSGYFLNTVKEPLVANKAIVEQMYVDLLGRKGDPDGVEFWAEQLDEGARTVDDVRWHFVAVRFAADDAVVKALASRVSNISGGGVSPEVIAEQTYRLFLEDLAQLR